MAQTTHPVLVSGFDEHDTLLFTSLFKLSQLRNRHYRGYRNDDKKVDLVVIDAKQPNLKHLIEELESRWRDAKIILVQNPQKMIYTESTDKLTLLNRPLRWANLLSCFDQLMLEKHHGIALDNDHSEALLLDEVYSSETQNSVEISNLTPWYDENYRVNYKTPPAILVVDGKGITTHLIHSELVGAGINNGFENYRIDHAESCDQALDMNSLTRYNAIIIDGDSNLGDYMRLMRYVKHRADRRRIAIITIIEKTSLAIRLRHNMNGSDLLLVKPIEIEKLCNALRKFIPKEQHATITA